jgi:hypothetical protein
MSSTTTNQTFLGTFDAMLSEFDMPQRAAGQTRRQYVDAVANVSARVSLRFASRNITRGNNDNARNHFAAASARIIEG